MLVPAITKKDEIIKKCKELYYTVDMMYETGSMDNWFPEIADAPDENNYQYAIVDIGNNLIGYIGFRISWYDSCAYNFGLLSFDRGNGIVGKAVYEIMNKILNQWNIHRVEWRMVCGNPVERSYDRFLKKYNGKKHVLRDVVKDREGRYHDIVIYEIINDRGGI